MVDLVEKEANVDICTSRMMVSLLGVVMLINNVIIGGDNNVGDGVCYSLIMILSPLQIKIQQGIVVLQYGGEGNRKLGSGVTIDSIKDKSIFTKQKSNT